MVSVVALGTYDKTKPRVRILLKGLEENGVSLLEIYSDIWGATKDKSQISGFLSKLLIVGRMIIAYPSLAYRYLRCPEHDLVLVGYLGLFDVLFLWPFVKLRGKPLVWDVFISLYNTVVEDRTMVSKYNPIAHLLWLFEWLALHLVDLALIDTRAHADYLSEKFRCPPQRIIPIFVGAEPRAFEYQNVSDKSSSSDLTVRSVLFYGQFIPLHGIETIVRAAKLTRKDEVKWTIIGTGQESEKIHSLVKELEIENLQMIDWIGYEQLVNWIAAADIVLGIFGTTEKATMVIPNKVFQTILAGRPFITADTVAIRELLHESAFIKLISQGSPEELAEAVMTISLSRERVVEEFDSLRKKIVPSSIGKSLLVELSKLA